LIKHRFKWYTSTIYMSWYNLSCLIFCIWRTSLVLKDPTFSNRELFLLAEALFVISGITNKGASASREFETVCRTSMNVMILQILHHVNHDKLMNVNIFWMNNFMLLGLIFMFSICLKKAVVNIRVSIKTKSFHLAALVYILVGCLLYGI